MSGSLAARAVEKTFGRARVLAGVTFEARAGEIHALAGANGAGKSTLLAVLSGALLPDRGDVDVFGDARPLGSPLDAQRRGVATIHQELALVGSMTVAENLALGRAGSALGRADAGADARAAAKILAEHELDVDPNARVETLPIAAQQLLEIARALAGDARAVLFDEPTSALGEADAARLLDRLRALRDAGKAVVLVSHRLEEVLAVADRVTVLRDGEVALAAPRAELDHDVLVRAMIGRELAARDVHATRALGPPSLVVRGLDVPRVGGGELAVRGLELDVARGAIVGLAGFRGSGASEALRGLFGAEPGARGDVRLDGERLPIGDPRALVRRGVVFLPADRKAESVFPELVVREASSLASLERDARGPFVDRAREARRVGDRLGDVALPPSSLEARTGPLSGGTQQKVSLLRALLTAPRVLLADEPTRGVDVGAKAEIARRLVELAASGAAIVIASAEVDELLALASSIVVLARGRVVDRMTRADATRERVVRAATSG